MPSKKRSGLRITSQNKKQTCIFQSQRRDVLATSFHLPLQAETRLAALHAVLDPAEFTRCRGARVADVSKAVLLADGVYLPWVKLTSEKCSRSWAKFTIPTKLFAQVSFVHHRQPWDAGLENTILEARKTPRWRVHTKSLWRL